MAISVFDLFKIGIGPSSSHTVGPMRAAALFTAALRQRQALSAVRRLEVRLYGSLSATGVGHGTDRAVIMGLMGEWPDRIDPTQIAPRMAALLDSGLLQLDGRVAVPFDWVRDMRLLDENLPYHPNAMTLAPPTASRTNCTRRPTTRSAAASWSMRHRPPRGSSTRTTRCCPTTSPAPRNCCCCASATTCGYPS